MEEKKGLLSALAETLKQYEMNQADNKDSLAIALEEKLEEIAKMISSLSDRVDHLSSRLNSIDEKVDAIAQRESIASAETGEVPEPIFETLAEDSLSEEEEEEEFSYDPEEETTEEPAEEPVAEEDVAEEPVVEEETVEEEPEVEEEIEEKEAEEPEEEVEEAVEELCPVIILGTMGINDKLEFVRELFHSDPALFNAQMTEIDTMPNFKAIVQYFRQAHPEWKEDSDTVYRLYMHIRRKFRN